MKPTKLMPIIALMAALLLGACSAGKAPPTPTMSVDQIETAAVSTFANDLTQTALYAPTATLTPSPQPTNTLMATISAAPLVSPTVGGVASCNNLVYVADVTIPDNTQMKPGESFTKTWRVQNTGSCAWGVGYKFALIGGDAMGGQAVTLTQPVAPGATYEISVPMTAPMTGTGSISGTWRMADTNGAFFGDAVTVVITLSGGGGGGATATTGPSSTPAPSSTP